MLKLMIDIPLASLRRPQEGNFARTTRNGWTRSRRRSRAVARPRKLAAILVSSTVRWLFAAYRSRRGPGFLARLRTLRSDLIDPTIAVHHGRIVKRTGDGRRSSSSTAWSTRCAAQSEIQTGLCRAQRWPPAREAHRVSRRHSHVGDVVEESDGDLMGDGVNIASRLLEGIARPGAICLSEQAYWGQVKGRLEMAVSDLGATQLQEHRRDDPLLFAERSASRRSAKPVAEAKLAEKLPRSRNGPRGPVSSSPWPRCYFDRAGGWYVLSSRLAKPAQAGAPTGSWCSRSPPSGDPAHHFADGITNLA